MAIFAVCAAHPQGIQSLIDLFNPLNYFPFFLGPPRNQHSSNTGTTSTSQQSSSTSAPSNATATSG